MSFKKRLGYYLAVFGVIAGFGLAALSPVYVSAADPLDEACQDPKAAATAICKDRDAQKLPKFVKTLVNALLYVLGAVSIIVIIFAGFFYSTSGGDAALITKAKNTLIYAVVGLIVALMAYAVVNFVLKVFPK